MRELLSACALVVAASTSRSSSSSAALAAPRTAGGASSSSCDLALVTAAVVFSGGALSAVAVFYVWPIVLASVLPAGLGAVRCRGGRRRRLRRPSGCCSTSAGCDVDRAGRRDRVPPNWMLITVCLHVAAFLLIALLAGASRTALVRQHRRSSPGAKADTEAQLRRMQATNEQLRVDEREQPRLPAPSGRRRAHARRAGADRRRHRPAQRLRPHPQPQHRRLRGEGGSPARSTRPASRQLKELGLVESPGRRPQPTTTVTDPQVGRLLKAVEKDGFHGFLVAPLRGQERAARRRLPALPRTTRP